MCPAAVRWRLRSSDPLQLHALETRRRQYLRGKRGAKPKPLAEFVMWGPPRHAAEDAWPREKSEAWARATVAWVRQHFPDSPIAEAALHMDETNRGYWRELHDFARLAGMAKTPATDGPARQPNVLALANHVLAKFFGPNCRERLAAKLAVRRPARFEPSPTTFGSGRSSPRTRAEGTTLASTRWRGKPSRTSATEPPRRHSTSDANSTDGVAQRYVRDICPLTPGRPSVADVRPLSTLRPGECYAVLADGRLERRRLDPYTVRSARCEVREPDSGASVRAG